MQTPIALYENTHALLVQLASEEGLPPEHLLEELIRFEYYSRNAGEGRGGNRRGRERVLGNRECPMRTVHIPLRTQSYEMFQDLLRVDRLPSEEMTAWLVSNAHHARHTRYVKSARCFISQRCGRSNCFVKN